MAAVLCLRVADSHRINVAQLRKPPRAVRVPFINGNRTRGTGWLGRRPHFQYANRTLLRLATRISH